MPSDQRAAELAAAPTDRLVELGTGTCCRAIVAAACASGLQSLPRVPPQRTGDTSHTRMDQTFQNFQNFREVDRKRGIEGPERAPAGIRVPVHAAMGREPV